MSSSPLRIGRVRGRRAFSALRRSGVRHRSGPVTVTVLRTVDDSCATVAYAVSRSVGGAVDRNRVRRRLRAIVREADLAPGSYLVSVSPAAATIPFDELAGHVRRATNS